MPTLKVCTGFEHGVSDLTSLTKGNTGNKLFDTAAGSPTMVSTGAVRSGTYALELNPSAASEYVTWGTATLGASQTVLVGCLAIRFPGSLPGADCTVAYLTSSTAEDQLLRFRASDSKLVWQDHNLGTATVGPTVAADTWYIIDFRYNVSAATHTVDWQVDGTAQTQHSRSVAAGTISEFALGHPQATQTITCRYDDVLASTTSADYPLGAHKVLLLTPDTGGTTAEIGTANATARFTSNGTVDSTHNSANILTAISEVPPTIGASADGVAQRTAGSGNAVGIPMTTYTLGSGESISGLRILVVGWAGSATANNIGMRTYNGATETTLFAAADPNFDNNTTSPGWLCKMATLADFDTQSELDALVVRYGYSTDVAPVPGAHAIYAELAVAVTSGLTAVGKDLSLVWDTRAALGDSLQAIWDVRSAVSDDLQAIWDVRANIGDQVALLWDVRASVGASEQFIWDVRATVSDDLSLLWDVASSITSVGKDLALIWDTRAAFGDDLALVWDVRAALGDIVQLIWDTRAILGDEVGLVWDVRAALGDTVSLVWDVRSAIGDPVQLIWDVRSVLGDDLVLIWDVRSPAGQSIQLIWDVQSTNLLATKDLSLVWDTRAALGDTVDLRWDVRSVLGDDLAVVWDVRASVAAALQALWDVRSVVGDPVTLQWDLRSTSGDDLTLRWDLKSATGQNLTLIWNIESLAPTLQHSFTTSVPERWRSSVPDRWNLTVPERWRTQVLEVRDVEMAERWRAEVVSP
jgi:hypothetical protein